MQLAFLNPQGNFDAADSYWTEHPDFGGQLVYVKEVALALGQMGHRVDIVTRQIVDSAWPEFAGGEDRYPDAPNVRILRLPAGPPQFLPKEQLWPHLAEWVDRLLAFYDDEGSVLAAYTTHYGDGGLAGALIQARRGTPFTFTGHSLGAQKMDKLHATPKTLAELDQRFHFKERIMAERVAMNRAGIVITSTAQERFEQYGHPAYRGAVDPTNDARFRVVPPGANLRIFNPTPGPADAVVSERIASAIVRDIATQRRRLPLIIASSRLDRKKNLTGLVEAFVATPELRALANLALVVRGLENPLTQRDQLHGEERAILDEIAAAVAAQGAEGIVTSFPLNSQEELAAGYRIAAADGGVFALTALYEPFGLAPLEAMACGLPAVVTRNGGPSESMVEDGREFGVLVDPTDPIDIARGLRRLLADEAVWDEFRRAGMERVESRYTWERTAAGYLAAVETLLAGGGAPGDMPIPAAFTDPEQATLDVATLSALYFPET
ncbi:MAG: glycosyltransferase [Ardenticatenaceae bacterium]|nr:glycosyltransferase [Ardenticatenaceae bacterium]